MTAFDIYFYQLIEAKNTSMAARIKPGDIYQLPSHGAWQFFARYVGTHDLLAGPLVEFFRGESAEFANSVSVIAPILCGLAPPVREGRWVKVGSQPGPVELQRHLSFLPNRDGKPDVWSLIEGEKITRLGEEVPIELRHLELGVIWPAELIEERLIKGFNTFSYDLLSAWRNQ